jgi:hypothetical protein
MRQMPAWLAWVFLAVFVAAGLGAVFLADPGRPSKLLSVVLLLALVGVIVSHRHSPPHG